MGDPERLASLAEQAKAFGLRVSITPGVEVSRRPEFGVAKLTRPTLTRLLLGRSLVSGEVGCAVAHHRTQVSLLDLTDEWLCVVEDDVVLSEHVAPTLAGLSQVLLTQPSVVLLGTSARSVPCFPRQVIAVPETEVHLVRVRWLPAGAYAYCINRAGARWVRDHEGPVVETADWPSWMGPVQFYVSAPEIAKVSSAPTGIAGRRPSPSRLSVFVSWVTRPLGVLMAPTLARNYDRKSLFRNLVLAPLSTSRVLRLRCRR
jgi:hypothetical protein